MKWTEEEREYLKKEYSHQKKNIILEMMPSRTWASILRYAREELGLNRKGIRSRRINTDQKIFENLINKKFNMLTILSFAGYKDKPRKNRASERVRIWNCVCECGQATKIPIEEPNLIRYKTKSCGCLVSNHIKQQIKKSIKPDKAFNDIYSRYVWSAKENNRDFSLTPDEFRNITSSSCDYCGSPPSKTTKTAGSIYIWNGIDRIDSSKGYILDNCCACCFQCNVAKRNLSIGEFRKWVEKISNHMKNTNQI